MKKILLALALLTSSLNSFSQLLLSSNESEIIKYMSTEDAYYDGHRYNKAGDMYLNYNYFKKKDGSLKDTFELIGVAFFMRGDRCSMISYIYMDEFLDTFMTKFNNEKLYSKVDGYKWIDKQNGYIIRIIRKPEDNMFTINYEINWLRTNKNTNKLN